MVCMLTTFIVIILFICALARWAKYRFHVDSNGKLHAKKDCEKIYLIWAVLVGTFISKIIFIFNEGQQATARVNHIHKILAKHGRNNDFIYVLFAL